MTTQNPTIIRIPLQNCDLVALVDKQDFDLVSSYRWYRHVGGKTIYAGSASWDGKVHSRIYMHRLLVGEANMQVDHIDHDGLNNRRSNLRICTSSQNGCNKRAEKPNKSSRFRGVRRDSSFPRWTAQISFDHQWQYLGSFATEEEAAMAYDRAAILLHGQFAVVNFPVIEACGC